MNYNISENQCSVCYITSDKDCINYYKDEQYKDSLCGCRHYFQNREKEIEKRLNLKSVEDIIKRLMFIKKTGKDGETDFEKKIGDLI